MLKKQTGFEAPSWRTGRFIYASYPPPLMNMTSLTHIGVILYLYLYGRGLSASLWKQQTASPRVSQDGRSIETAIYARYAPNEGEYPHKTTRNVRCARATETGRVQGNGWRSPFGPQNSHRQCRSHSAGRAPILPRYRRKALLSNEGSEKPPVGAPRVFPTPRPARVSTNCGIFVPGAPHAPYAYRLVRGNSADTQLHVKTLKLERVR